MPLPTRTLRRAPALSIYGPRPSVSIDVENSNRSARVVWPRDQSAGRRRDQEAAVRAERHGPATHVGHSLPVNDSSAGYIDQPNGPCSISAGCDEPAIGAKG